MNAVQQQLPLLVPLSGAPTPVRLESLERQMIERIKLHSGFSRNEIIRRAVKYARLKADFSGSCEFLINTPIAVSRAVDSHNSSGRKSKRQKITELERTIRDHLRAADIGRRALSALKDGHAVPPFQTSENGKAAA